MASKTELTHHDRLVYLHIKYEGDWDKIGEALSEKEDIDPDIAFTAIESYTKTNASKFISFVDEDYPSWLRDHHHPLWVVELLDDSTLPDKDVLNDIIKEKGVPVVWVESKDLSDYLAKNEIPCCCHDPETHVTYLRLREEDNPTAIRDNGERLCEMGDIALATAGESWFVDAVKKHDIALKLSLPDVAGSNCNNLIKRGEWALCDSADDIKEFKEVYSWLTTK